MTRPVAIPASIVPLQAIGYGAPGTTVVAVDPLAPLPVGPAADGVQAVTIALDASRSAAIDLDRQRLHRIEIAGAWTAAAVTFQTSTDGSSFTDLHDGNGEVVVAVASGRTVVVDPGIFFGIRWLRIRSGTAAAPVTQAAQRSLTLCTVAR